MDEKLINSELTCNPIKTFQAGILDDGKDVFDHLRCIEKSHAGSLFAHKLTKNIPCAWNFSPDEEIWDASLVVDDNFVCAGQKGGKLTCLDAQNGQLLWTKELGFEVQSRSALEDGKSIEQVFSVVNAHLHVDIPEGRFVTFALLGVNLKTHKAKLMSAGHGPSYLIPVNEDEVVLDAHGLPFGIVPDQEMEPEEKRWHRDFGRELC